MRIVIILIIVFFHSLASAQLRPVDRSKWVDFGSSHISKWLQIAPGKMGPNALPVPEMDYARIDSMSSFETAVHSHFMEGDYAINSYFSLYWSVVPKRVGVKLWGNPSETFKMNNEVRDERQIYYDDTGWITNPGDLWISTFIQLVRAHNKWPDISINYSIKTTTGWATHGRYTDAPANYYYAAFGKSWNPKCKYLDEIRIGLMGGFYVWQTNKVELAQDEGPLYEIGIELKRNNFTFTNEVGGFSGYDAYRYIGVYGDNDPLIYRTRIKRTGKKLDWKFEYQTGLIDYHYQTFKFGLIYRFAFGKLV